MLDDNKACNFTAQIASYLQNSCVYPAALGHILDNRPTKSLGLSLGIMH